MDQKLLKIVSISKSFRGLKALTDISLEILPGEVVGLIGPNGAGKTTLFNVITGFLKPDHGEIYFSGETLLGHTPHEICKRGIARTFQIVKPFSNLSTLENVAVGAFNCLNDIRKVEEEAWGVLDLVGLSKKALDPANSLTTPDRKKLELARALATKPKLLLLDEVMAGLNPKEEADLTELIHRVRENGVSVFIIEHHMQAIMKLSDRIVVIHHGVCIANGEPKVVCEDKRVIEAYLGKGVSFC